VLLAALGAAPGAHPPSGAEDPAFVANAIVAAARAFHRPLSDAQAETLRAVTEKALAAEREHAGPTGLQPTPTAPAAEGTLARAVERTQRLRSFRDEVSALLDEPQRRVIYPESIRDRAGLDVFGPAFGWGRRTERLPVAAEARRSEVALGRVVGPAGPEPPQLPKVRAAVDAWFAARKEGPFVVLGGELSRRGFPTLEESLTAARATISLLEHVAREGGLRPEQVARLLGVDVAVVLERAE
jgi:hypothetical protein